MTVRLYRPDEANWVRVRRTKVGVPLLFRLELRGQPPQRARRAAGAAAASADDLRYPIIDLYWKNAFSPRAC